MPKYLEIFYNTTKMQPNQKPIKDVIKNLMTGMNNHDPDVAEMAAKDLCKHILQGDVDLKAPENA